MISFPNPFNNWSNSLNDAVRELSNIFNGVNESAKTEILLSIQNLETKLMADLNILKDAVAANNASVTEIGDKLSEVGAKLTTESEEIKAIIQGLEDKINFDVLGLQGEVDKLTESTAKLNSLGTDLETLGTNISVLVTPEVTEVPAPVTPVEEPAPVVEPPVEI